MEVLLAITGKDFVLTASSRANVRGIAILQQDDDKSRALNDHNLLLFSGEAGDATQFAELIQANVQLSGKRNEVELKPSAVAHFTRRELADALRSKSPYMANMLLAGYNNITSQPSLYWIDYVASFAQVPYAAHGYGAYFTLSILDRYHKQDLEEETALDILRKCFSEVEYRMAVNLKGFIVKKVSKEGISRIDFS